MTHESETRWLRSTFAGIAETAVVDEQHGRADAWRALRRRTRRRARRRVGTTILVVVGLAVAGVSVARTSGHSVKTTRPAPATTPTTPAPGSIVTAIDGFWAPEPIAYDGTDVWLARKNVSSTANATTPLVVVERRDAASGRLLSTIGVHQEAVFSIAVDRAGSIWVAGGGDGGVPTTTVSRIDAATQRVTLTHTLTKQACACQIVAGAGGVWIGGNGSEQVLRIDERTGEVAVVIALPRPSRSLAIAGDRLEVELDGSRVAVIDPATNRVERTTTVAQALPSPAIVATPTTVWIFELVGPNGGPRVLVRRK